jgi:hypothetical protein
MGNMVWVGIVYANYSPDSRCAGAFLICFIGSCGGVCRPSGLEVLRNAPQLPICLQKVHIIYKIRK